MSRTARTIPDATTRSRWSIEDYESCILRISADMRSANTKSNSLMDTLATQASQIDELTQQFNKLNDEYKDCRRALTHSLDKANNENARLKIQVTQVEKKNKRLQADIKETLRDYEEAESECLDLQKSLLEKGILHKSRRHGLKVHFQTTPPSSVSGSSGTKSSAPHMGWGEGPRA